MALNFVDVDVLQRMRGDIAMGIGAASVFFLFGRVPCREGEAAMPTEEKVIAAVFETFNPDINMLLELYAPGSEFLGKGGRIADIGNGLFELTKQKHNRDLVGDRFVLIMVDEEDGEDEEPDNGPQYQNLPACASVFEFDFVA